MSVEFEKLEDLDELTRKRIDSGATPDYELFLNLKGYRKGNGGDVRWRSDVIDWSDNVDLDDTECFADILEKVAAAVREEGFIE